MPTPVFEDGSSLANFATYTVGGSVAVGTPTTASPGSAGPAFALKPAAGSDARAWHTTLGAVKNTRVSVLWLNTSNNANGFEVFCRGANLGGTTPTYYSVDVVATTFSLKIRKRVAGTYTDLATVANTAFASTKWLGVVLYDNDDGSGGVDLKAALVYADSAFAATLYGDYLDKYGLSDAVPQWAIEVNDPAANGPITAAGFVGVNKLADGASFNYVDDFGVLDATSPTAPTVTASASQTDPVSATLNLTATATSAGGISRVDWYIDGTLHAHAYAPPYTYAADTTTWIDQAHTIEARAYSGSGPDVTGSASISRTSSNPSTGVVRPALGKKFPYLRVTLSTGSGSPFPTTSGTGKVEDDLIARAVDFSHVAGRTDVIPHVFAIAPTTPCLIYTNITNVYQDILLALLNYADSRAATDGLTPQAARESCFWHVAAATTVSFTGSSFAPARALWLVFDSTGTDYFNAAFSGGTVNFPAAASGNALYLAYPEKFRQLNITISTAASGGYAFAWEYPTAVDGSGAPTTWGTLTPLTDGTSGLTTSGLLDFDPPTDWVPAAVAGAPLTGYQNGTNYRLYYVRARVTGSAGTRPVASQIIGRNYTGATSTLASDAVTGTIPAFDTASDVGSKGYLTAAEYAGRAAGKDAYFDYESRMSGAGSVTYGESRWGTNAASAIFGDWVVLSYYPSLQVTHLGGFFSDNVTGRVFSATVREDKSTYGSDFGALHKRIARSIPSQMILPNSSGFPEADAITRDLGASQEESLIHTSASLTSYAANLATVSDRLVQTAPSPWVVADCNADSTWAQSDARTQMTALAAYLILHDPSCTFFNLGGGNDPAGSWSGHWFEALAYCGSNLGTPIELPGVIWKSGNSPEPTVQGALQSLPGVGAGNVAVTQGGSNGSAPWTITFQGSLGNQFIAPLTVDVSNLGPRPTASIVRQVKGSSTVNEYQGFLFNGVTGGTFKVTFNGQTTGAITYSTSASTLCTNIRNAVTALSNVGAGNFDALVHTNSQLVSGMFQGTMGLASQPLMTIDGSLLTGPTPSASVTVIAAGDGATNAQQKITLTAATSGTLTITFTPPGGGSAQTTVPIAYLAQAVNSVKEVVYRRRHAGADVYYKPVPSNSSTVKGTAESTSAATYALPGTYAPLQADGTLGTPISSLTLRGGEGAVLFPAGPATSWALGVSPASGVAGQPFTVSVDPNGTATGNLVVAYSGGGLTPGSLTFPYSGTGGTQSQTLTPPSAGTVTLTPSNTASLTDPSGATYTATSGPSPSISLTETYLPANHGAGTVTAHITGSNVTLASGTAWTVSGVAGWSVNSWSLTDSTHGILTLNCPAAASPPSGSTGTLTITDTTDSAATTIPVQTPTLVISPTSGNTGTTPTLTLTGAKTRWTSETAAGLFSVSGGAGASVGTPTVTSDTAATDALTVGSAAGTLTVRDTSTGAQATFTATAAGSPLSAGTVSTSNVASTTLTVSTTPASGGTSPYLYQFQRAPDVGGSPGSWANVGPNSSATSFNDSGLTPSTPYWYRCVATDSATPTPATATSGAVSVTTASGGGAGPARVRVRIRGGRLRRG